MDETTPQVGDRAPETVLVDLERTEVPLSSLWASQPVVLIFARHFG